MALRVLGIDPGLTRCGVGIVDVAPDRSAALVYVGVIRTPADAELGLRLLAVAEGIADLITEFQPQAVAVERVFAQHNLRTVMATAQASGVALAEAAKRGIPVALHTPSEVKAAITGYGSADKRQVGAMVARVLGLPRAPTPADAADALALAICHAWKGTVPVPGTGAPTPAQEAWRNAENAARVPRLRT